MPALWISDNEMECLTPANSLGEESFAISMNAMESFTGPSFVFVEPAVYLRCIRQQGLRVEGRR